MHLGASGRIVHLVALVAVVALGGAVIWKLASSLAGGADDPPRLPPASGASAFDARCNAPLPTLPDAFAVEPGRAGSGFRLLERGRLVGQVLTVPMDERTSSGAALQAAEAGLRRRGSQTRRASFGPFAAVVAELPVGGTVVTQGLCRSYSILARTSRSARGITLMLLTAEGRELAGLPPAEH